MKKVKFVYNPMSGDGMMAEYLDQIVELYQKQGYSITLYRLNFEDNPYNIIYDIDDSYHHILIAGGDGTINFVVNLMKRHNVDVPIAVLPAGTANDFSNLIGMNRNPLKACKQILKGDIERIDLGKVNGEYFVNVFSCGLFTDVSQKTPAIMKNTFGKLAYYMGGLGELSRFRKMEIKLESDGGEYDDKCVIFFVFNGRTAGQFRIAYLSEFNDGKLDVVVIKGHGPLKTLQTLTHFLSKNDDRDYPEGVEHIQCSRLIATSKREETTDMDGQPGPGFPLDITCEAMALQIIIPNKPASKVHIRKVSRKERRVED